MIDPMSERFDMAIKHGASASAAHPVPGAMDLEPFGGRFLASADFVANNRIENFRATARDRPKPSFFQKFQRIANRHFKDALGQVPNLNCGESFDVEAGIERAQLPDQIEIPILFQGWVQAANHVDLRDTELERLADYFDNFIDRVFESVSVALFSRKRTELAGKDADIRVIDIAIMDVGRIITVLSLADYVRYYAESVEIVRSIEIQRVIIGNALAGLDLFGD